MFSHRQYFTCILLGAGTLVTGCMDAELEQLELVADEEQPATPEHADELASNNNATPYAGAPILECSSHNVIGVLSGRGGDCSLGNAPMSFWQWHTMFDDFTPDLAAWTEPVPGHLQRYCIFEYVGPVQPDEEHYGELFTQIEAYPYMSLDSVAPDCRGEVVQGEGLNDPAVTTELANAFHEAIQWIPGKVLDSTEHNREYAQVAIIDTVSQLAHDDPNLDPVNEHGLFMGDIVRDIACGDSPAAGCEDAIRYHIAMPREEHEAADWEQGGQFGTMGDLAMSVVAAVGQWRQNRLADSKAPQRLILSASLGWVPEAPVTSDPDRGPVRALEEALVFAACNGAIVVSAAGNITDPACTEQEQGPLAPATYELVEAPSEAECAARGYTPIDPGNFPVFGNPRPLVYAVGGLDGRDRPIINARRGGMPGLAAYAANASVETSEGFTLPLTGTSVSTAVVAATAGLVWSYAPELPPGKLMEKLYESGFETQLDADFDFAQLSPRVRRVSVCAALEHTCQGAPVGFCPDLKCGDPMPPDDGHLDEFFAAIDAALADPSNEVESFDSDSGIAPVCEASTWDEQIDPQPEHPACPTCGLDSPPDTIPDNDMLTLSLSSKYKGYVEAGMLVVYDGNGDAMSFTLSKSVIKSINHPSIKITEVAFDIPGTVAANLTFWLSNGKVQDGPIPVRN
ncbi:MAG: S8/S53 family peptidase [Enhygromyxa sp.]